MNKGVKERDQDDEYKLNGGTEIEKSRIALEQKSKIYNELAAKGDDTNNDDILVDFLMKQPDIDCKNDDGGAKKIGKLWKGKKSQMVEIIDEFGRNRMVREDSQMARDYFRALESKSSELQLDDEDYPDKPILEYTEPVIKSPRLEKNGMHFDASKEKTRMMGVGFYQFSSTEGERAEQMHNLRTLRTDTIKSRENTELMKQKRLQKLEGRKALLAERAQKRKREHFEADVNEFLEKLSK